MELSRERKNEILGIIIAAFAVLLGVSLFSESAGIVGRVLKVFFMILTGKGAYIFPFLIFFLAIAVIRSKRFKPSLQMVGLFIVIGAFLTFLHVVQIPHGEEFVAAIDQQGGGLIGSTFAFFLQKFLGKLGAYIILAAVTLIGFLLLFDVLLVSLITNMKERSGSTYRRILQWFHRLGLKIKNLFRFGRKKKEEEDETKYLSYGEDVVDDDPFMEEMALLESATPEPELALPDEVESKKDHPSPPPKTMPKEPGPSSDKPYQLPSLKLLTGGSKKNKNNVTDQSELLEKTLESFGVQAKVVSVSHGPTITRYELQPAPGVKVSRIVNLADDIALSMAATDVRIVAPIPGKSAVGVEVPNPGSSMVRLRDILMSSGYQKSESPISLALGVGIAGEPIITNLTSMPHLLVAGATGSGKSVCINTMILSILYKARPDQVKLLLVDPKKVELTSYRDLPHLLAPVVTDPKKAAAVLKMVVQEMENRYELFASSGTRGIDSYNNLMHKRQKEYQQALDAGEEIEASDPRNDHDPLPLIVVIIDELADLMMVAANDVEDAICRLAQMARAAGIHLIIATQRPSVDVITGLIKANIPSRIAFAVSSQVDSRTILDSGGAEKLLGKGDMLFAPVGSNKAKRVQGAFVSTEEVNQVVKFVKKQEEPEYAEAIQQLENGEIVIDEEEERDELYEDAVRLVVSSSASISMLQRRLHIGYTRAARLIDTMERDGIVGPYAGSKAREVMVSESEIEAILQGTNNND